MLQVHDELIFDVPAIAPAITNLVAIIRECMEMSVVHDLELRVNPL